MDREFPTMMVLDVICEVIIIDTLSKYPSGMTVNANYGKNLPALESRVLETTGVEH
jgi:hypothetical protein